jgi:hypothetical protein
MMVGETSALGDWSSLLLSPDAGILEIGIGYRTGAKVFRTESVEHRTALSGCG